MTDPRATVLVIDDDAEFAGFIACLIENEDCQAVVANDAVTGLNLAKECNPALILCDLVMTGFGGDELLRILQVDPTMAHVPRVLMSGHGCPDLQAIPADAFIAKPINTQSLRRVVRAFTRRRGVQAATDVANTRFPK